MTATGELVAAAPGGVTWRLLDASGRHVAAAYLHDQRVHRSDDGTWYVVGGPCDVRRDLRHCEVLLLWRTGPTLFAHFEELEPLYGPVPPGLLLDTSPAQT